MTATDTPLGLWPLWGRGEERVLPAVHQFYGAACALSVSGTHERITCPRHTPPTYTPFTLGLAPKHRLA